MPWHSLFASNASNNPTLQGRQRRKPLRLAGGDVSHLEDAIDLDTPTLQHAHQKAAHGGCRFDRLGLWHD